MSAVMREEDFGCTHEGASRWRHVVPVSEGALFCENPGCVLHVRARRPGVVGAGEWATRPDGIVTSRDAEPGSTVVAGQAVVRVIEPASLWVKARFDQGRSA